MRRAVPACRGAAAGPPTARVPQRRRRLRHRRRFGSHTGQVLARTTGSRPTMRPVSHHAQWQLQSQWPPSSDRCADGGGAGPERNAPCHTGAGAARGSDAGRAGAALGGASPAPGTAANMTALKTRPLLLVHISTGAGRAAAALGRCGCKGAKPAWQDGLDGRLGRPALRFRHTCTARPPQLEPARQAGGHAALRGAFTPRSITRLMAQQGSAARAPPQGSRAGAPGCYRQGGHPCGQHSVGGAPLTSDSGTHARQRSGHPRLQPHSCRRPCAHGSGCRCALL